ncbi:MAG: type II 3-dehydroquinate dehydratase [Thermodesulfobacteriota bacterium]
MRIMVINGPNMNMLGKREPGLYGVQTLPELEAHLKTLGKELGIEVLAFQSNIEGELVDALQKAGAETDGVILNGAAYTHTSVAIRDAVSAIGIPVVEVHLTNPQAREEFRRVSFLAGVCAGSISGFGADSYVLALRWFAGSKLQARP